MKIAFCLRAIKTLGDSDLASLTDKIEAYTQAGMDTKAAEMAAVDDMLAEVRQERAELQDAVRTQHPGLFVGPSDVKAGAITPDDAPADAPAAQEADPADRRQKAAQMVRESVVKKTNANSAMVWQIIHEPTGEPVSGPPGVYPGRELLGSSRTMGNLGWGTKRDAEAALAELNRKADGVLGEAPAAQEAAPAAAETATGTESLNKRHSTPKKQALTPAGALKADATNSRADSAVWHYQGDMGALRFTASVTVDGKADKGADRAVTLLAQIAAAQEAGWKRASYRAGSLGTVWVFEREGEFLTRAGMENAGAVEVQRPAMPKSGAGYENMVSRQRVLARSFDDWLLTLPEIQQYNRSTVSRKIGETPVGQWAGIGEDKMGLTLQYLPSPGEEAGKAVGWSIQTQAKPDWAALRDHIAELAAQARGLDDAAPSEAAPAAHASPLDADRALWKRIAAGQASVEDFKAGFESWTANKAVITDDFTAKKKDDLLQMGGGAFTYRYKSETKPQIVDALWRDGLSGYTLGRGYSYGMSTGSQEQAVRLVVESTDADQLAQYAADLKTEQEEVLARVSKMAEAIKDPKTLNDYQTWMRATMVDGMAFKDARLMLTPEQRAAYDDLAAEASRGSRKASTDADSSRVSTAGQSTSGEIIATKHTKLGHDLWVVKLADRVSKDDYGTLLAGAKRLGGNYSSYRGGGAIPGFQFRAPDAAQAFLKLAGGDKTEAQAAAAERRDAFADDRSQSATERLTEMADRLDERADESLGRDRKTNTSRRAGQAASAEAAASDGKAMAKTMRNLATAIGNGAAKFLDRVRQKVQVEMLQNILRTAHGAELRAKFPAYIDQELNNGAAPTLETADFAEFPTFTAYRSDLASLARQLLEVDGTKLIGQRLMKVADDVSGAYLEFAKANFHQVATFSSKSGGVASFGTSAAAEQALARSGYKGKAIAYQVKRGEHTVIMSPSEAMARGVWKGDGDKRITLAPDLGAEMVEKIGRAARRGAKVSVPWQLESAYDRRKALARMGIETPAEMRAALREFISLREQAAAPDKVKQLERAMIGRRNDGMDFFPTPEATADEMVAAADIQPGMRVLEPSAGWGHIAERIKAAGTTPEVGELSDARRELLEAKGFNVVSRDFLEFTDADHDGRSFTYGDVFRAQDGTLGVMRGSNGLGGGRVGLDPLGADGAPDQRRSRWESFDDLEPVEKRGVGSGYDRILMNPPFSDGRDIQHVRHAFDLLKPGGRVVAIMGEAAFTNQNKRAGEFRDWLESVGGTEEKLPTGTFLDSDLPVNTGANARMVVIDKTGAEPDTQFSRAESQQQDQPASSARRQAVEALVQQIAARWANAPEVVVVNSLDDPRVPESVRRDETTQQSKAGAGAPEGFFHDGKVYLIAEQLPGDADVVRVLLHEALGHFGLRGTFGADLGGILDRVAVLNAAKVRAKAKQYGLDYDKASDRRAAAEEVLAEMAQSTPTLGWGKKAIAAVRTWLRSHVPGFRQMALSDDEVVRSFILPARAFVQRGGPAAGNGGSASFSRGATDAEFKAAELAAGGLNAYASAHANGSTVLSYRQWVQVRTPSFKEWWGNDWQTDMRGTEGGVRQPANSGRAPGVDGDAAGRFIFLHQGTKEPRVFFHGTRDDFSTFDPAHPNKKDHGWLGVGHYVTSDHWLAESYSRMKRGAAESRVMELFVRPNNPKMLTVRQKLGLSRVAAADVATMTAEWVASGRRGAAVVYDDDTIEVATFDGSGLKSATGNSGAFDPASADIRYSRASIADAVSGIADKFNKGPSIVGETGRKYTPSQLAAMRNVGFQTEPQTIQERAKALWSDAGKTLAQGLVDQFAPVKAISEKAYGLLRLSKGASGAFEALLQGGKLKISDGVYDFDASQRGGVVDTLFKPLNGEHHDFLRWVAANRADRLIGVGKENLFTPEDVASLKSLADGDVSFDYAIRNGSQAGQVTRSRSRIYADSLRTFNDFNTNVLDMAEESGLIDGEARTLWENEFYVPFYRVEEDGNIAGANIKNGAVRQQAFRSLTGRKNKLNADLLDNTLMNWAHLLDAGAKNRAAKASIEAAEKMGAAELVDGPSGKGTVWFRENGDKRYSFVSDPHLLTAISALEYAGMRNPVMNAMGAFKRALTVGVTASPFFKIRNLIRDSVQAVGTGNLSYNIAANVAQGWKLTDPASDSHFRLLAGGGTIHFGTMMEGNEAKRVQALVESGVDAAHILDSDHKVKAFYRKFIEPGITAYNELGNRGEEINRASLYDQLMKQGLSHAEASLQARDLMDFSMQGSFTSIRFLTQVVPFLNARIQGLYKLGRAAKEDPARFSTVLGAVALMSLALLAAYSDDDDWKKREEWDRNNFWWFKIGGTALRIPKPFEIGAIATLAERGFELAFDKEMTGSRFRKQVLTLFGDSLAMNPIPQMVKPILDVYANKNSFTGRPIETMGMEKLKPEYRVTEGTTAAAKGISAAANAAAGLIGAQAYSPVQVDSLLRGYFGWLGSFVVGAGDVVARMVSDKPAKATPDYWKAATGGIVSDLKDAPSRYVSQMYEQAAEVEQAYGTWQMLRKQGRSAEAAEFQKENQPDIDKHRVIGRIKRTEARLNGQIRSIQMSDRPSDEKRALIREIQIQKDQVARRLAPAG